MRNARSAITIPTTAATGSIHSAIWNEKLYKLERERMRAKLALVVLPLILVVPRAADNTAWFGTPVPPPLSDPRKPIMKHDDAFAVLPTHFAPRAGRHDELLDGAVLKADHRKIVGFSLESLTAGDKIWGRR